MEFALEPVTTSTQSPVKAFFFHKTYTNTYIFTRLCVYLLLVFMRKLPFLKSHIYSILDLTDLDNSWDTRSSSDGYGKLNFKIGSFGCDSISQRFHFLNVTVETPPVPEQKSTSKQKINNFKLPSIDPKTQSFIPQSSSTNGRTKDNGKLPPICISTRTEFKYVDVTNNKQLIERLQREQLKFMIQRNFYVLVKIVKCKEE